MSAELAASASASGLNLGSAFTAAAAIVLPHIAMFYGFAAFPVLEQGIANILPGLEHTGEHAFKLNM